ncbi:hypothetical protein J6590_100504 [Homalodisca vitripennis]|nr:hypothetical protein J6590_100504 [Homalodisca vitripennis]
MQGDKQWGREVEIYEDSVIGFGSKGTVLGQYLRHVESDTLFERAHLVELNAANRISKGLSNPTWRVVLGTHCKVHYALPFLTGSSYSDAGTNGGKSRQDAVCNRSYFTNIGAFPRMVALSLQLVVTGNTFAGGEEPL